MTPNRLTLLGLPLGFLAAYFLFHGALRTAACFVILLGACDLADGFLAKRRNLATPFGAFLDSTVDRVTELALFGGILSFYLRNGEWLLAGIAYWVMGGSFLISYTRARAEALMESLRVGFWERPERMVLLILGLLLGRLETVLWILAFGTTLTAFHRILYARRTLKNAPPFSPFQKILLWDYPRKSWPYRLYVLLVVVLLLAFP